MTLFWPLTSPCFPPGYRCFKAVLFLTGLLFGSVVIFLLCYRERVLETQLSAGASAGIALGIGLLCGLVAMLVRSVGLFLVGLLLGLLLAAAALLGSAPYYQPGSVWGPLGLLLGGGADTREGTNQAWGRQARPSESVAGPGLSREELGSSKGPRGVSGAEEQAWGGRRPRTVWKRRV